MGNQFIRCYIERMGGILWYVMSITKQYLLWLFIFPITDSCSHFSGYFYTTRKDITVSTISLIREETLTLWSNLELSFQGSLLLSSQNHPTYSMFEVNPFYIWQAKEREREKKKKKKGQFSWILSLQMSALNLLTGSATTGPTLTRLPHNLVLPRWR